MAGCIPSQKNVTNGKIIFQSNREWIYDLYVMNLDGSNQQKIDNFPNGKFSPDDNNGFYPSPDGKQIAFLFDNDEVGEFGLLILRVEFYQIWQRIKVM